MFGKIHQTDHRSIQEQAAHCSHNCGLCKTIGREYGLLPRVLLNSDLALLQEMLGSIDEAYSQSVERRFVSEGCFRLPELSAVPASFRYSAAITLLFAEHKLRDNIRDLKGLRRALPRVSEAVLAARFVRARAVLNEMAFPIDAFDAQVEQCDDLEHMAKSGQIALETLAEDYGRLCGIVARHACSVIGKSYLGDSAHDFGVAFGSMIYVCDAFEDLRDDVRSGAFNPLVAIHGPVMSSEVREHALSVVRANFRVMCALSEKLSGEADTGHITRRIALNLERVFQAQDAPVASAGTASRMADRWRAFVSQTHLKLAFISDQNLTPGRAALKALSAIATTMVSVLFLGCYASPVPLANRTDIDPALLGEWKTCGEPAGNELLVQRLNQREYLVVLSNRDGTTGNVTKSNIVAYPSRVGGRTFLNLVVGADGKVQYRFWAARLDGRTLEIRLIDDTLFKRPDASTPIVFDSSEELTRFVASMANDDRLLTDAQRYCR